MRGQWGVDGVVDAVALALEVNSLAWQGVVDEATRTLDRCLNTLMGEYPAARAHVVVTRAVHDVVASSAHVVIENNGETRLVMCSPELVSDSFSHRLDSFRTLAVLLSVPLEEPSRDGSLIFDTDDGSNVGAYPRAAFASALPNATLVVDPYWVRTQGYAALRDQINSSWLEWDHRAEKVFWRGSSTGQVSPFQVQGSEWSWLQRAHLCEKTLSSPNAALFDVGISNIVQVSAEAADSIRASSLTRPPVSKIDFLQYKYLIDVDGNACAWDGLFSALLMGACVLKIDSEFGWKQWYYGRMRPAVHFLPVKHDLSDLDEVVTWAFDHPAECRAIAENARSLALSMQYDIELVESAHALNALFR